MAFGLGPKRRGFNSLAPDHFHGETMTEKAVTYNAGIGFTGWLTLLFIGLKLTGYITWSWWWVLSPAWIPLALGLGLLVIVGIFAGLAALLK